MPDWDELYRDKKNALARPDVLATELSQTLPPKSRVLDFGCGGGRHVVSLADDGHYVVGTDISPRGFAITRERLTEFGLDADLVLADFRAPLPFGGSEFDAVLSIKAVNHALPHECALAFSEALRVLKPGGWLMGTVLAAGDARNGDGELVAVDTFVFDRPPEEGVTHHFFREAEIREFLRSCGQVSVEPIEREITAADPIWGGYRFSRGRDPVFRHWNFRARL